MSRLAKIELHLHLEGAAPPALIRAIAAEKHTDLGRIFAADGSYAFRDFAHFLTVYEAATSVLTTPEDYARLTTAICAELADHGVIYAETFLSPDFCGGGDVGAWRDYLAAIEEAATAAAAQGGPIVKGIVTCIRHFGPEASRAPAICAAETAGDMIVGFGMAGNELTGEPRDYTWAFDCAREAGLHLTAHAGEWRGPDSVRGAVRDLGVARIGHGVRAIEDAGLVEDLAQQGIVLEVCPGSNIALGVYAFLTGHPVEKLRAAGVPVTISTDDPPFFHTTMSQEYSRLAEAFGWTDDDFTELNKTAARAAFCSDDLRADLLKTLDTAP